jgi:hypothetical protein
MLETVVGIITGLFLLVGIVAGVIIWRRHGRNINIQFHSGAFPFSWRANWSSVPTHIVTQTNPTTEGVKVSSLIPFLLCHSAKILKIWSSIHPSIQAMQELILTFPVADSYETS